jgi:tetratricopeptide (TPR) repeat protein
VDWQYYKSAVDAQRDPREGLLLLQGLKSKVESPLEEAVLYFGMSMCLAALGDVAEALNYTSRAKHILGTINREVAVHFLARIELSEAALHEQQGNYELADREFLEVRTRYPEVFDDEENADLREELIWRHACTLVKMGRHSEAIPPLEDLLGSEHIDDRQRVSLFLGVALIGVGRSEDAKPHFLTVAEGSDAQLRAEALSYLADLGLLQ